MALSSGVGYVTQAAAHVADVTAFISGSNIASERNCSEVRGADDPQWGTDKYVVPASLRLQEGGSIRLPGSGRGSLGDLIRGYLSDLQRTQCTPGDDGDPHPERQLPIWTFEALTNFISSCSSMLICARLFVLIVLYDKQLPMRDRKSVV